MPFFDNFVDAIETYPDTNVTIEIVDVETEGDALNVNEEATFKVKVTNNGPLNLAGVMLRMKGLHGTTLRRPLVIDSPTPLRSGAPAGRASPESLQWVEEFVSTPLALIEGDGGSQSSPTFTLKAPGSPLTAKNLVKASLEAWDADLTRILVDHSKAVETVKGIYNGDVVAA